MPSANLTFGQACDGRATAFLLPLSTPSTKQKSYEELRGQVFPFVIRNSASIWLTLE